MSDLVYQNYNNKCQGWVNPSNLIFGPQITSLSGYQSPAGSNTIVAINGTNFYSYSSISFGTFNPTVYFINSNLLEFYIPNTLSSGTFTIQVFNGSIGSNIVTYTIDNASGYWLLTPSGSISNTNTNGVGVSWISRGNPTYLDGTTNLYPITNPYVIQDNENWILCYPFGFVIYVTLPSGTKYTGREITFRSVATVTGSNVESVNNNISNGDPTSTLSNIIIQSGGTIYYFTTLVYDGSNWIVMQSNW
jgi:hypothetical protein